MGRKRNWSEETTAIRVPVSLADRLLSQARAWDSAADPAVDPLKSADQVMSPLNPCRVRFEFQGQATEGRAVGALVNWRSGTVAAVLIDWSWDGKAKQTQLPIHQVEFLDLPEFCTKKAAVPRSYPPYMVTVADGRGTRRYTIPGGTLTGEEIDRVDQEVDRLLAECDRLRVDPLIVVQELCEQWLKPVEQSA